MLFVLQKGGGKLETLDLIKSIASTLSYLIVVSVFVVGTEDKGAKNKVYWLGGYFIAMLVADVTFTALSLEVYANYVFLAATAIYIYTAQKRSVSLLKCLSHALTIFVAFNWIIIFAGSIAFLLFSQGVQHDSLSTAIAYVVVLSLAHIAVACLLRKFSKWVFKNETSDRLASIDIGAKLFFVGFFNLLFPMYFEALGMKNYATLSLVLLIIVAIFTAYREYSTTLESKLAVSRNNLLATLQWAKLINERYKNLIPTSNPDTNIEATTKAIESIDNIVVQALMRELAIVSNQLEIELDIDVEGTISNNINLDTYDLFTIVNGFIENAIHEAEAQTTKSIKVKIDNGTTNANTDASNGLWLMIQTQVKNNIHASTNVVPSKNDILAYIKKNSNIFISVTLQDSFVQVLDIR